ncbi:MAG: hypothetical protein D6740_12170 [Alphaproteobacteria bacterium]|nr:MAG: hypothetical protein D6740_12170 [Alphaproteobacteria bacterium]
MLTAGLLALCGLGAVVGGRLGLLDRFQVRFCLWLFAGCALAVLVEAAAGFLPAALMIVAGAVGAALEGEKWVRDRG